MAVSFPGHDICGEAAARLARHQAEMRDAGLERRDLDTDVGNLGSVVPPAYLLDQYITYARPSRPVANISEPSPSGRDPDQCPKLTRYLQLPR